MMVLKSNMGFALTRIIKLFAGGSSNTFKIEFSASAVKLWALSIIKTLSLASYGFKFISLCRLRIYSIFMESESWVSIQCTSGCAFLSIFRQEAHLSQESMDPSWQFTTFASVFATSLLPIPSCPLKRYARLKRDCLRCSLMICMGLSWPLISWNDMPLY